MEMFGGCVQWAKVDERRGGTEGEKLRRKTSTGSQILSLLFTLFNAYYSSLLLPLHPRTTSHSALILLFSCTLSSLTRVNDCCSLLRFPQPWLCVSTCVCVQKTACSWLCACWIICGWWCHASGMVKPLVTAYVTSVGPWSLHNDLTKWSHVCTVCVFYCFLIVSVLSWHVTLWCLCAANRKIISGLAASCDFVMIPMALWENEKIKK